MVCVCVPFFLLIFGLQTRAGMRAIKRAGKYLSGDGAQRRREKKLQMLAARVQADIGRNGSTSGSRKRGMWGRRGRRMGGREEGGIGIVEDGEGVAVGSEKRGREREWWRWARRRPGQGRAGIGKFPDGVV